MASSECRLLSALEATVTQLRTRICSVAGAMEIFELETITIERTNRSLSLHFLQSKVENLVYNVQMPLWIGSSSLDIWNAALNVETWVFITNYFHTPPLSPVFHGFQRNKATGFFPKISIRDFHPSAFSPFSHPSSFHRDSPFSTHK
ncbi:hypothetical protein CUMW_245200, partial [Citrus unshiu]